MLASWRAAAFAACAMRAKTLARRSLFQVAATTPHRTAALPVAVRPFLAASAPLLDTALSGSWPSPADPAAVASAHDRLTLLHEVFAELKSYGIASVVVIAGVLWVARTLGKLEAVVTANKELAAAVAAANKEVAASAVAATEAKVAANEKVVAEVAKGVSLAAELAALKAVRVKAAKAAPPVT